MSLLVRGRLANVPKSEFSKRNVGPYSKRNRAQMRHEGQTGTFTKSGACQVEIHLSRVRRSEGTCDRTGKWKRRSEILVGA